MALIAALSSSSVSAAFTTTDNLGNTMYVGDSITDGISGISWRWWMHKILTDNAISYTEQGILNGYATGIPASNNGSSYSQVYGDSVFMNVHSSRASARMVEISGLNKVDGRSTTTTVFGNTSIMHWLNQDGCATGSPVPDHNSGYRITEGTAVDTFFLLIGTNDLLSQGELNSEEIYNQRVEWFLGENGDMDTIVQSMTTNNQNAQIVVLTVPTWDIENKTNNNHSPISMELVLRYNEAMKEWAARHENVTLIDTNHGLIDVAGTYAAGQGVQSMFQGDMLHPSVQGALIMAGNVARQMGYAGATGGQLRKEVADFEKHIENVSVSSGSGSTVYEWDTNPTGGFTAAFSISGGIGNGVEGGWNTADNFSVSIGNGAIGGTLNMNEAYIQWGNTILFSLDTSDTSLAAGSAYANINDTIRIAYVRGNAELNLNGGFYIWMDDQLIGEALGSTATSLNGVSITNSTGEEVLLSDLWMDGTGSWAPSTARESYGNPLIEPATIDADNPYAGRAGVKAWPNDLSTDVVSISGNAGNIGANFVKGGIATGAASGSNIYGTTGRTSDLYLSLVDVSNTAHNGLVATGALTGNAYLRMLQGGGDAVSTGAWFASVNSRGVTGNLYMEFSADNLTVSGGDFGSVNISVAGVYGANSGISGTLTLVFNAGRFGGDIIGGSINANASVGAVDIYINGGTFTKNIAAGGYSGSVGNRSITITGDDMVFNGTEFITAGQADEAHFRRKTAGSAPSNNASTGSATVTIANVTAEGGFGQYTGTLSGGEQTASGTRTLVFSDTTLAELKATLENFDVIKLTNSSIGLRPAAIANSIEVNATSSLTFLAPADPVTGETLQVTMTADQGATITIQEGIHLTVSGQAQTDENRTGGTFKINSGASLTITGEDMVGSGYRFEVASGAALDVSGATHASFGGVVVVNDAECAGSGSYSIMGWDKLRLQLEHFTTGSSITGLTESDDITLTGKNRLVLVKGSHVQDNSDSTALLQGGVLGVEQGASLVVDINDIISDMAAGKEASLTYFLSKGGFADVEALKGAMSFDATLVALGWKVDLQERGTLVFSRATGEDLLGGKVLLSDSSEAETVWNSSEIYTETAGYDAIVVNDDAYIDLRDKEVPSAFAETGLLIKNLMGSSDLTVQGDAATGENKVTLSNRLDQSALDELAAEGFYVDKSLTYSGNITIIDAQLRVAHMNPADLTADTESATIVQGDVKLVGMGGVDMAGGVLELQGQGNDFGAGALVFSAGDAGQVVVNGGRLTLHGAVSVLSSVGAAREHIRLENAGVLALADGAAVQQGVIIGDAQGNIMDYAHSSAGTLAVEGLAALSAGAQVQYVHMLLAEDSRLTIIGSVSKTAAQGINAPEPASVPTAPGIILRGLSGSGALATQNTTGEEGDLVIAVAGGTHTFTGNLADYNGTMYVSYSPYAQVFSGVKGGSDWNLVNYMGNVVFNLMGENGTSGNMLTMGELVLASGSSTTILMDLTSPKRGGLNLTGFEVESGAAVTIGHYDGTTTLAGENGETRRIAVGVISSAQGAQIDEGVRWSLVNVRNAELVDLVYENGTLYLVYGVDNSNKYAAVASNINSLAGAQLLWELGEQSGLTGDLGAVDSTLLKLVSEPRTPGNIAQANKLLAAAAGASSAVLAQAAGADVERQLRTMRNRAAAMGLPDSGDKEPRSFVWMNAETSYYKLDAAGCMPGFRTSGWGGTVGLHIERPAGVSLGLALTAMYNDLESAGPDRLKGDMDNYYLSGIVRMTEGAWQHTFVATVGTADIDARRTVNYGEGSYTTRLSTDGMSFGLMYELGYAIPLNDAQSTILQPIANITWRYNQLDAYSETGSDAALSVAEQSFSSVVFGLGARLQAAAGESLWNTAGAFELRALIKANAGDRAGKAQVAFSSAGLSSASVRSAKSGVIGFELGAGISVPISNNGAIYADFSAELGNNRTDLNATLGYKVTF